MAAAKGDGESVQAILGQGASTAHTDEHGDSPLHASERVGSTACVAALRERGAALDARNRVRA